MIPSSLQIEVIKQYGVKPFEISHLKNNRMNKIGKKRRKYIELLLSATIMESSDFIPFAENEETKKMKEHKYILVLVGLKNDLSVLQKRLQRCT